MKTNAINPALASRLAAKKAGKYRSPFSRSSFFGGTPFQVGDYKYTFGRWAESPEDCLTWKGNAHSITGGRHHCGWYTDEDGMNGEVVFGVVYALPARRGFIAGINDPFNGDKEGRGPCVVEVKENGSPFVYDDETDAARAADSLAERYAEVQREHNAKYEECSKAQDDEQEALSELDDIRGNVRALVSEIRASVLSPGLCKRLRDDIKRQRSRMHSLWDDIRAARQVLADNPGIL